MISSTIALASLEDQDWSRARCRPNGTEENSAVLGASIFMMGGFQKVLARSFTLYIHEGINELPTTIPTVLYVARIKICRCDLANECRHFICAATLYTM